MKTGKEGTGRGRTEKHIKTPKRKRRVRKKAILIVICVLAVLVCGGLAMAGMTIKPPTINNNSSSDDTKAPQEEREDGIYNILVVGTDKVGFNTDTILVMSLDSIHNRANVLSIPRDTMSNVSRTVKKINAAYSIGAKKGKGNIENLKKEVSYLLGFDVDNYVVINLGAFEEIIDAIGGVTIDVPRNMNYDDPYQNLHIHLKKGVQTLTGKQAIGFVRYRSGYAEGDLGRVKAQQAFIQTVAKQLASPSTITKVPKLTEIVLRNMDTDLTNGEMLWFAKEAINIDMQNDLKMFVLPGHAQYVNKLSYYLPNQQEILQIVNEYFNPYATPISSNSLNIVNVNNVVQKEQERQSALTNEQRKKEETLKDKAETEASVNHDDLLKEDTDGQVDNTNATDQNNGNNGSINNNSNNNNGNTTVPSTDIQTPAEPTPANPDSTGAQPGTVQNGDQTVNNTATEPQSTGTDASGYQTIPGEVLKPDTGSETNTIPTDSAA